MNDLSLNEAMQHLQAGRLGQAEQLCRSIIQQDPLHAEAHRILGLVAFMAGRVDIAESLLRRAVSLQPDQAEYLDNLGVMLQSQGKAGQAELAFRQALAQRPDFPEAHYNLGISLRAQGKLPLAEAAFQQALTLRPDHADTFNQLALTLQFQNRLGEAIEAYDRALAVQPNFAAVENNRAYAFELQGRLAEAEVGYRRAVQQEPQFPEAWYNLGNVLKAQGRMSEAEAAYRQALSQRPNLVEAYNNLGHVLHEMGRAVEAEASYRQAIDLRPSLAEAHNNLGNLLQTLGRLDEAEACYRKALEQRQNFPEAANNLCNTLDMMGRQDEAVAAARLALALRPDFAAAHVNLGNALQAQGRLDEALAAFGRALELDPSLAPAQNNFLKCSQHTPGITAARLAEMHADWDRRFALPLQASWRPHPNDRDPDRRLRIGMISGDFALHPVGFFLVRLLESLDRQQCQVTCYTNRLSGDVMTARLKEAAAHWYSVLGLSDEALAERIRADGVDLLIDLSGHTASNRLLVFARKPAPVQLTWIGYVGTTGLTAIDYLIADRYHVPEGEDVHYREKVLRLPDGYVCYDPPKEAPEVGPLPAQQRGLVTFGSFNNPMKLTPPVVALWTQVLRRVPGSRLLLQYRGLNDSGLRRRLLDLFAAGGIGEDRLELRGWVAHKELLDQYNQVDIALDTFPYSGGLTTCEALWMGVPVVTFPGETFAGRHSFSHCSNVGLHESLARDRQDYVEKAVSLASDLPRLAALRAGLRPQMADSPLCDGPRFAANFLAAMRNVWQQWCRQ